jgi:predicted nucleic acid-binding protein
VRILFDTNVLLDVLLAREPFVEVSATLFDANVRGAVDGVVGATTVTTIYYLVARERRAATAQHHVKELLRLFDVAPVSRRVLVQAMDAGFDDYEDAVLAAAADGAGCDGIVTRNETDFGSAALPVYTPAELLTILDHRGE